FVSLLRVSLAHRLPAAQLVASGRRVPARGIPIHQELEGAPGPRLVVGVAELLGQLPQTVAGRVVPAMRGVRLVRTLDRSGRQDERQRDEATGDHSMSGAPVPATSPDVGLEAFA